MKIPFVSFRRLLIPTLLLAVSPVLSAATFTSNAFISSSNTNFDGQDIVVIGCTLTIDGSHAFSDVILLDNGVITHSFSPTGLIADTFQISGEEHTLAGTTAASLAVTNVNPTTIIVTALTNSIRYANGIDYTVTGPAVGPTQIARTPASTIPDGATVLVTYNATRTVAAGLTLAVTNNVIIDDGCAIYASGGGYGGGAGPGAGGHGVDAVTGTGGGHGGLGGATSSPYTGGFSYGMTMAPINLGSGGGIDVQAAEVADHRQQGNASAVDHVFCVDDAATVGAGGRFGAERRRLGNRERKRSAIVGERRPVVGRPRRRSGANNDQDRG